MLAALHLRCSTGDNHLFKFRTFEIADLYNQVRLSTWLTYAGCRRDGIRSVEKAASDRNIIDRRSNCISIHNSWVLKVDRQTLTPISSNRPKDVASNSNLNSFGAADCERELQLFVHSRPQSGLTFEEELRHHHLHGPSYRHPCRIGDRAGRCAHHSQRRR